MVVPGLDSALEGKELDKEYKIDLKAKEAFGERDKSLLKTIPLKIFTEKNINPRPGMVLALDNSLAKIVTVSGARVITDFNNPLAGKDVSYKFKITRIVDDVKEKAGILLEQLFRFVPEFEINEREIVVVGEKYLENFVSVFKDKVKELLDKELKFREKSSKLSEESKEEKKEDVEEIEDKKTTD